MIGIVVPFFQRKAGLLSGALMSISRQCEAPAFRVYVVDDGSPVPPEDELASLPAGLQAKIELLRQKNAGPAAARNLALDALHDDVRIVAFLDSDDTWDEWHLANVTAAFEAGAEFYFADYKRPEATKTCFERTKFAPAGLPLGDNRGDVHWCDPKIAFDLLLVSSPIGTPTVAYNRDLFGDLRFDTRFRAQGEDTILWAEMLSRNPRLAVSTRAELYCGYGVNVSSFGTWGEERVFRTLHDTVRYQTYLRRKFSFSEKHVSESLRMCREIDFDIWASVLAMLRRRHKVPLALLLSYVLDRPIAGARFPAAIVSAVVRKVGKQAR